MSHQPFEQWILDDIQITPQEQETLDQHLKECPECHQLHKSWHKVQSQIRSTQVKAAPAGFVKRWKNDFALRKREQERRQARTLLISLTSGIGAVAIAMAIILLPDFSLISLTVGFLTTIIKLFSGIESLWSILRSLVTSAPTFTLVIGGLLTTGWISLAAFAWGISIWRITTKGVKNK